MIYYVTAQQEAFEHDQYQVCSVKESLKLIDSFTNHMIQFDTETTGKLKILDYLRAFIRL